MDNRMRILWKAALAGSAISIVGGGLVCAFHQASNRNQMLAEAEAVEYQMSFCASDPGDSRQQEELRREIRGQNQVAKTRPGERDIWCIDWQAAGYGFELQADFPLLYQPKSIYNLHLGGNVCTVGKHIFWDFRYRWLKEFEGKHPEVRLYGVTEPFK